MMNSSTSGFHATNSSLLSSTGGGSGGISEFSYNSFSSVLSNPGDGNSLGTGSLPASRERAEIFTAQIVVMCVLAVTVMFGLLFLSCGLLRRTEGFVDPPGDERRTSKDGGMC
uniref:protein reprimo B-like n=1 Tax=Centroberyx gerrardi TaxID=166262 RepID=UPI003AAE5003